MKLENKDIREELVTLKTALLAREKGFTDDCYDVGEGQYWEQARYDVDVWKINGFGEACDDCVVAPSQSLLQKFLREKHGIFVISNRISCDISTAFPSGWQYYFILNNKIPLERFSSYEEALEAGLYEALKLIK